MSGSSTMWPSAPRPADPEPIVVSRCTYSGRTSRTDPSRLGDDLYTVTFSVRGVEFVLTDVGVPEAVHRLLIADSHKVVPFVAANLHALRQMFGVVSASEYAEALQARCDRVAALVAEILPSSLHDVVRLSLADASSDATSRGSFWGDVGAALFAEFPDLASLTSTDALVASFGEGVAAAVELLGSVSFTSRVLKTADGYGDCSVTKFVATRGDRRSAPFRCTGGIHQPGAFAAAMELVAGRDAAAELFSPAELEVLAELRT